MEADLAGVRQELLKAEAAAREKDKALADALKELHDYHERKYGLRDAVKEIKDLKQQVCFSR